MIITSRGTKGLLEWLKAEQPDFYAYISPQLIALTKSSNLKGLHCMPKMLGNLGDTYASYIDPLAPPAIEISSAPITDLTITPQTTDAATAASSSPTSNALAASISALANGYSNATLTAAQISANNTLLQTNLARAQQGLPPLTMSTAGGFTTVGSNSGLLLVGIAIVAALALGGSKKAA